MYPVRRKESDQTGGAAQVEDEGAHWLSVDARTPPGGGCARINSNKLCSDVYGLSDAPRAVRMPCEQSLTILSQPLIQRAKV